MKSALADVPWLTVSPASGQLNPGQSMLVELTLDADELDVGDYVGYLVVTSNDPDDPFKVIPVNLAVRNVVVYQPSDGLELTVDETFEIAWAHFRPDSNSGDPGLNGVSIDLSIDGGATFPIAIAQSP